MIAAERRASGAANSRSEVRAEAIGSRLQANVRRGLWQRAAGEKVLQTTARMRCLGNHLDFPVQRHQQQLDFEGRILLLDPLAQLL